jgi:hypothetical protein
LQQSCFVFRRPAECNQLASNLRILVSSSESRRP